MDDEGTEEEDYHVDVIVSLLVHLVISLVYFCIFYYLHFFACSLGSGPRNILYRR